MSQTAQQQTSRLAADDYVGRITRVLESHGHPNPKFWEKRFGGLPIDVGTHPDHYLRRHTINRQWQSIIAAETLIRPPGDLRFRHDAITARYCLMDRSDCDMETWIKVMTETTLPFICRYEIGFRF